MYGGGIGRARGAGGRERAWCLRERTMPGCFVPHGVADRLSDLGAGLSGLDRVGTAREKHEQCGGVARQ